MAGQQADVPLLTGSNSDEGSTQQPLRSWDELRSAPARELGPDDAQRLLAAYRSDDDPLDVSRTIIGRKIFNWQNRAWARAHARTSRQRVFTYAFDLAPPAPAGRTFDGNASGKLGAFHTAEIPYIFGTLATRPWAWRDVDHRLSSTMMSYWTAFIANGDPNAAGLPPWPAFDADAGTVLHLGHEVAVGPAPFADELAFWDEYMARLRNRT
jgi:para-nitrobenzyl esterase